MILLEKLEIPSDPNQLVYVDEVTEKIAKRLGFSKDMQDDIAIAVTEAVNNAIMHGNNADARKKVFITFYEKVDRLIIMVKDEGKGFDPDKLPDPTCTNNLMREKGRGFYIIKHLMDDLTVKCESNGMLLILEKKIS